MPGKDEHSMDAYINILSEVFDLDPKVPTLNVDKQPSLAAEVSKSWLFDGLLTCLRGVFNDDEDTIDGLNHLHEELTEILNTGHYSEIPDKFRSIYGLLCLVYSYYLVALDELEAALGMCDSGLLKGFDFNGEPLAQMAELISEEMGPLERIEIAPNKPSSVPKPLSTSVSIPIVDNPALETFYNHYLLPQKPVIIREMVENWPAFHKWSFESFYEKHGRRTVPVEFGKYTDDDFSQCLMSLGDYIRDYVAPAEIESVAYMAQHRLLDQIPTLQRDIIIPDYTTLEDGPPELLNCFIGPENTVSPLHIDPRHNFFCQIRGRKFVRLIHPRFCPQLYMFDGLLQANSSRVNVEVPNYEEFPLFSEVVVEDFLMEEGDCLFIPKGYFHFVRSLERSISVSIWFGQKCF